MCRALLGTCCAHVRAPRTLRGASRGPSYPGLEQVDRTLCE